MLHTQREINLLYRAAKMAGLDTEDGRIQLKNPYLFEGEVAKKLQQAAAVLDPAAIAIVAFLFPLAGGLLSYYIYF